MFASLIGGINLKMIGAVLLTVAVMFAWRYYEKSQATMLEQAQQIQTQKIQIEQDKLIKKQQAEDIKHQVKITTDVTSEFSKARSEVESLRGKFDKINKSTQVKRDLGKVALRKRTLIQKIINNGTKNAFRCIEIASGATHTAAELAATKKSEVNNECPTLANPNYIAE